MVKASMRAQMVTVMTVITGMGCVKDLELIFMQVELGT